MLKIFRLSLENSWKSMHLFSKIKHLQVLRLHFFSALVRTYPHNWSFPGNVFHIKELLNTLMGSLFSPSPRIDHSIGLPPLYLCRIFILFLTVPYQQKRFYLLNPGIHPFRKKPPYQKTLYLRLYPKQHYLTLLLMLLQLRRYQLR